jgi:hypothetical protein
VAQGGTSAADVGSESVDPSSPLAGFLPPVGVNSRSQLSIQLASTSGRVATVTVSLTYPGVSQTNCDVIAQATAGPSR